MVQLRAEHLCLLALLSDPEVEEEQALRLVRDRTGTPMGLARNFLDRLEELGILVPAPAGGRTGAGPEPRSVGGETGDDAASSTLFTAVTPQSFALIDGSFEYLDHAGRLVARLAVDDLVVLEAYLDPRSEEDGHRRLLEGDGGYAVDRDQFAASTRRLRAAGLLRLVESSALSDRIARADRASVNRAVLVDIETRRRQALGRFAADAAAAERRREEQSGRARVPVIPMYYGGTSAPAALGLMFAYGQAWEDGRLEQDYFFHPDWDAADRSPEEITQRPGVFLFSNYLWNRAYLAERSRAVKELSPESLTIHGGPDTPTYQEDAERYLEAHPHVDVIVRGEGEDTLVEMLDRLAGTIDGSPVDLEPLVDVPGLIFRHGGTVIRTPDRERIADLDKIPSPLTSGLFDCFSGSNSVSVVVETNRGCPYGCTFCDWGSSTRSRLRNFSLERVYSDLEWIAKNEILGVGIADSNFGIHARDVEIAQMIADLKATHGYPQVCGVSYAKNTVKHLETIVRCWVDAGIITQGVLSLQTVDDDTLQVIKRKNIRVEKYDALEREFRSAKLPLFVDLMMGLPGQTPEAFADDLQDIVNREVQAKIHETTLLVNSPMNEPSYRERYQIETENGGVPGAAVPGETVVASSTFTREQFADMDDLRRVFNLVENAGVLRHVGRFVRQQVGVREIDLYRQLRQACRDDPNRYPSLAFTLGAIPDLGAPPVSWALLMGELRGFLVDELGVEDDSALDTVLRVQHALLPAHDRSFPETLELAHDYPSWWQAMLVAKGAGEDWTATVPPLIEWEPTTMRVDDPHEISYRMLGVSIEHNFLESWELDSPVARPILARTGV